MPKSDSYLSGSNIDFIEGLFARYLENPTSVDASWRELFDRQRGEGRPIFTSGNGNRSAGHAHAPHAAQGASHRSNGASHAEQLRAASLAHGQVPAGVPRGAGAVVAAAPLPGPTDSSMQLQARVGQVVYAFRLRGHLLAQLDPLGRPRP